MVDSGYEQVLRTQEPVRASDGEHGPRVLATALTFDGSTPPVRDTTTLGGLARTSRHGRRHPAHHRDTEGRGDLTKGRPDMIPGPSGTTLPGHESNTLT
ncbi:hypothetical protein [Nocardiopsis alkaliphila]|uniref:hypothetical protein n=1 Tax=Nocardiopsis alkaliphila TaxID=225762 RepID=UPI0003449723|nr:hypothetical protein [Nocardiopsis alkaliphila]